MSGPLLYKKGLFGVDAQFTLYFDRLKSQYIQVDGFTSIPVPNGFSLKYQMKINNFIGGGSGGIFCIRASQYLLYFTISNSIFDYFYPSTTTRITRTVSDLLNIDIVHGIYHANLTGQNNFFYTQNGSLVSQYQIAVRPNLGNNTTATTRIGDDPGFNRYFDGWLYNLEFYTGEFGTMILKPDFANAYTSGSDIIVPDLCGNYTMKARNWTDLADYQSALKRLDTF